MPPARDKMLAADGQVAVGGWNRAERIRLSGIAGVIALLHVAGWSMYFYYTRHLATATSFAGAGTLAYALGVRHAFDADHIAAIDDTTRLMLARGRRPVGVGFFFAMGHSSVVLALAFVVVLAAHATRSAGVAAFRAYGGIAAAGTAMTFLLLVATLNALVLAGMIRLWRQLTRGRLDERELELQLLNRGLMNRILGNRARGLIRSSWHMFPVGVLFGLGLETASEITLLALSASTAASGALPALAVLTLPLLFAAGMSAFDTCDGLLMSRAYSWAFAHPARKLYYNLATTGMTVVVAFFVGTVYLAGLLARAHLGGPVAAYATLGNRFELLGYFIVGVFVVTWGGAALTWRLARLEGRYGRPGGTEGGSPVSRVSRVIHPIEEESYAILRSRADTSALPPWTRAVVERVIHASADVGYLADLVCDEDALAAGARALAAGAPVAADSAMTAAGITCREAVCRVNDPAAAALAGRAGITRSAAGIRAAYREVGRGAVWVIGTAPTALAEVMALDARPALVIGLPVGFVGAAEVKQALRASGLPAVTNRSEKGGAAVAAAALNALLYREDDTPHREEIPT